jgi:hypothetical protein
VDDRRPERANEINRPVAPVASICGISGQGVYADARLQEILLKPVSL